MRKIVSLTMAAVTALSCSPIAMADDYIAAESPAVVSSQNQQNTTELENALRKVKTRITIPAELSEFTYYTGTNNGKTTYSFEWSTPYTEKVYKSISCSVINTVITRYSVYDSSKYNYETKLADLTSQQLYSYAEKAVKKLNPTVYKDISIDKDSLNISLSSDRAVFSICRTKNGVPVKNNSGRIVINKNTGNLVSFNINWSASAGFKKPNSVISEEKAMKAYNEMIDIYPVYQLTYDREKDDFISEIIYTQKDYGEINAFTGKKSDFIADGYFGDDETCEEAEDDCGAEGGVDKDFAFTEKELEELNKVLPYATEEKIRDLLESSEYLTINDSMELYNSHIYKDTEGKNDKYIFSASFSSADYDDDDYWTKSFEICNIVVNAETGEILSYDYYNNNSKNYTNKYDEAEAAKIADEIAKEFAGEKYQEYGEFIASPNYYSPANSSIINYYGSFFYSGRYVNDIVVESNNISIELDCNNKLINYSIRYTDADFISPENMLKPDEIMDIFWKNNDIDLYYLTRVIDKKTKTVLVYGTDENVYCDAFTGEQKYYYVNSSDLSGISSSSIKKMAKVLNEHGFILSDGKFSEKDAVKECDFANALNMFTEVRLYGMYDTLKLTDGVYDNSDKLLTVGDAMIMLTAAECGTKVPELSKIFKSPYTDISDTDEFVGYYAIAHALTNSTATKLNADAAFTYGDMIKLIYNYLA